MKKIWIIPLLFISCFVSEDLPPDQDVWRYDLPANQGLNQNLLLDLNARIKDGEFQQVEGLSIIRNNRLVFENYYNGADRAFTKNIGRSGLLVTLAALGVAVDQRAISLEDSIYQFLPEFIPLLQGDEDKMGIKVKDIVTHRTGLEWNEGIEAPFDFEGGALVPNPENDLNKMKQQDNWVEYLLSRTSVGLGFYSFSTANGILLARIIQNATGMDFNDYINENIFNPLEIDHSPLEQDASGNYNGGDGYFLSLLEYTKIGFLFLQDGMWKGRVLLNTNFTKDATSRQHQFAQSDFENSIGYFWIFFGEGLQPSLGVEYNNIIFLRAEFNQVIYIIPDEEMVVTILSENYTQFGSQSVNLFSEITRTVTQ